MKIFALFVTKFCAKRIKERCRAGVESPNDPSETGGQSYILRMGYSKATQDVKMTSLEFWGVIDGDYEQVELDSAGKNDITVICRMDDELPQNYFPKEYLPVKKRKTRLFLMSGTAHAVRSGPSFC